MTDNTELKEKILKEYAGMTEEQIKRDSFYYSKSVLFHAMEQYHLARLEAITPEMIEKKFPNTFVTEAQISLDDIYAPYRKEGAKWVLEKLKQP